MATTGLSNVIIKSPIFGEYFWEMSTKLTTTYACGMINASPIFNQYVTATGKKVSIPFFKPPGGSPGLLGATITPKALDGNQSRDAVLIGRADAFSIDDIVADTTKYDPAKALATQVSELVTQSRQESAISILSGVVKNEDFVSTNVHSVYVDTATEGSQKPMDANVMLAAMNKLGDQGSKLSAILMHSAVFYRLQKSQLITYMRSADADIDLPFYLGRRVVVHDLMPKEEGDHVDAYWSFLFAPGVLDFGVGTPKGGNFETDRDMLTNSGQDILAWRDLFMMSPVGMSFTGNYASHYPTNEELATGNKWSMVYQPKNIPLVGIKTNA
jgi:hypothetical protein